MIAEPLARVLEATGYLSEGVPAAPTVTVADTVATSDFQGRLPSFEPDAWWRSNPETNPWSGDIDIKVYFKFIEDPTDGAQISDWQIEIWNQGFAPLLWVVSPERIDLYNGFADPCCPVEDRLLDTFHLLEEELTRLDQYAGRLSMETGRFWQRKPGVDRSTSVDISLLRHLDDLHRKLVAEGLPRIDAQGLIGRAIFAQFLIDRGVVTNHHLRMTFGQHDLPSILADPSASARLFDWLRQKFNGDMFPPSDPKYEQKHSDALSHFLRRTDPDGQTSLFPYQFDIIPVELISAIYEQFVHSANSTESAKPAGVHYTPVTAVSLILDEVLEDLTGDETILDITCGSGVFLVEAMRRLVHLRCRQEPVRQAVEHVLYKQIHGVDISLGAIRIAAFSLYLTALELDPEPQDFRFEPLIGTTLHAADAFDVELESKFDVIVGNPPFGGTYGSANLRTRRPNAPQVPRGESLYFLDRATDFAHDSTRIGMILGAMPFFSRSPVVVATIQRLLERLAPVSLVNMAELKGWLFSKANMPVILLLARCKGQRHDRVMTVQARWSPAGQRAHMIEIAPRDINTLPIASWERIPGLLKAAFIGCRHDHVLLEDLHERHMPLGARLSSLGVSFSSGLKLGNRSHDVRHFHGLPWAANNSIQRFGVPDDLPTFDHNAAERPRQRDRYCGPLVIVKEFMRRHPRAIAAVVEKDTIFADAYFGASFATAHEDIPYLVAGILGSALTTWHCLMTGSEFGLWKQRFIKADVVAVPTPDLQAVVQSDLGRSLAQLVRDFHHESQEDIGWEALDEAVFDIYELDEWDRVVVRDGLVQGTWQWQAGQIRSVEPASLDDLLDYARVFVSTMDTWLAGANRRRVRAEVLAMEERVPLRVIRFVLENVPGPSHAPVVVQPDGSLNIVLSRIGKRAKVPVTNVLVGVRDLVAYAEQEVFIIKPAASRNWLRVQAMEDADAVVQDSVRGTPA